MEASAKPDIAAQIAGALEWWRDAGVDSDFAENPHNWLANEVAPEPEDFAPLPLPVAAPVEAPRPPIGGPPEAWPQDLAAFQAWWLTEPSLDHGAVSRRVAPRGSQGAELMILVADPEEGDAETLLSGAHGKLLAAITAALGLGENQVYLASALPRRTPMPDWNQLAAEGLAAVVRHHIALARPERLLTFGTGISSLLDNDPANSPAFLPAINHEGRSLPLFAAMDLAALLARPRAKAGLWQRLLDWTGTTERD
jgi:DNA polymerase